MFRRRSFGAGRRRRALKDLDHDIQDYIDRETQRNIERGMTPDEACRQARLTFGNIALVKEDTRRVWTRAWLEEAGQDLRYGGRTLRRNRAFAIASAATLALAIGANITMFSVLKGVLLQPLPYPSPERLVMLWTEDATQNVREGRSSLQDVNQWVSQSQSFADIATFDAVSMTLLETDGAERIVGASISPNLLPLLGIQPALGRSFSIQEAEQRQPPVLISDQFWRARFGASKDAIRGTLVIDGHPRHIIGILPPGFQVAKLRADVWEPHTQSPGGEATWFAVGRLRPTVPLRHAQAEMAAIARRLGGRLPADARNRTISLVPLSLYVVGARSRMALWVLGGAVFCVLLIASANVASLSLARTVSRAREMAVRAAVGASVGRIVRQLLVEGMLLAGVAGLFGALLGSAGTRVIRVFGPENLSRLNEIRVDFWGVGWAVGISVLAGLLVGLPPASMMWRRDFRLAGDERGSSVAAGAVARRVRRGLVVAEFALAIILLAGAGLFIRSWWNVEGVHLGFNPDRVLTMGLTSPTTVNTPAGRTTLYGRVLQQLEAVHGVESAGMIGDFFVENNRDQVVTVARDGGEISKRLQLERDEVSTGFFKALGTPLLRGRFFSADDGPDAPMIAIVNDAMARRLWPGLDPVGRRFKVGPPEAVHPWFSVVGVVADMRRQGPERDPVPQIFVALAQNPPRSVDIFIRTASGDPLGLGDALRAAVHRADKNAPVYGVTSLEQQLGPYLAQRRFETALLAGFSVVALLMAAIGIYGLIQYSVTTRTSEIGVRMAIGARTGNIFRMVIAEGLRLSITGLALGLLGAWWFGRAGSSLLFGVTATDPVTLATVSLVLTAVALAACYFPARRAMSIDPITALRLS